eukprot:7780681-Alexandrium_andersonii.AAC.1
MHNVRCHDHASEFSTRIDVPWCPACMRCFHTVRRTIHHVAVDASVCRALVLQHLECHTHASVYREPTKADRARA